MKYSINIQFYEMVLLMNVTVMDYCISILEKRLAKDNLLHDGYTNKNKYFLGTLHAQVEDDHKPFQERGK